MRIATLLIGASVVLAPAAAIGVPSQRDGARSALSEPGAPEPAAPQPTVPKPTATPAPSPPPVPSPQPSRAAPRDDARGMTPAELSRYESKDANSPGAKSYQGGDTLVIGASAATVILAVVLLIVLL